MSKSKPKSFSDVMRDAIRRDGRSIYRLALDCGVNQAMLGRFMREERGLNLDTAEKVCRALGLELRPVKRKET
ncbi:MAG: helix-turn-helix domain-containing protein [Phycisphaerae bacterium]|nr:helix-turn-helix domain-containing protein [Phycisphaerae bacterium]